MGTQKNFLNETVLSSTPNIHLKNWLENDMSFTLKKLLIWTDVFSFTGHASLKGVKTIKSSIVV